MSSSDGARLLERLLQDPGFRARFRDDPATAAREAGLEPLADRIDADGNHALETLEIRESRSSLAGAMLAAALEGVGLFEPSEVPPNRGGEAALPSAQPMPAGDRAAPPTVPDDLTGEQIDDQPIDDQPIDDQQTDREENHGEDDEPDEDEPDEDEPDEDEPDDIEDSDSSDESEDAESSDGSEASDGSEGSDDSNNNDDRDNSHDGADPDSSAAPGLSDSWKPDPDQYGMAGGGGAQSPIDEAVLSNSKITLDANGREDFSKGRMDPRVGALLLKLAEKHQFTLSSTTSDHPQNTAGGSTSNHWYGRAFDIATVDGEIVRTNSAASRELAAELTELDASIRADEIGSPWAIAAPGYFTDGDHQDHIHIGFKQAIDPSWKPPTDLTGSAAASAAAAQEPPGRNEARVMRAVRPDQIDGR